MKEASKSSRRYIILILLLSSFLLGVAISVKTQDDKSIENKIYKPNIYLYQEEQISANVKINIKNGHITTTYLTYKPDGWNIIANPDGTLIDNYNREYNYLFWEGESNIDFDLSKGFIIEKSETVRFLERSLTTLGLNDKEQADFISYWLPKLESNHYNFITFQTTAYTDAVELSIIPKPDTLIRVYMVFEGLENNDYEVKPQVLIKTERNGYTVVEWGGTQLK